MSKNNNHYSLDLDSLDKNNLYVNEVKLNSISKDMLEQLTVIETSLMNINNNLTKLINKKVFKGNKADTLKGLSKKAKSQASAAGKLKKSLIEDINADIQLYPIKVLDDRISALEKKIASLDN